MTKVLVKFKEYVAKKLKKLKSSEWWKNASNRAIRTVAQTSAGYITVGSAVADVNWKVMVSAGIVAGIFSLLMSIATTLPEMPEEE